MPSGSPRILMLLVRVVGRGCARGSAEREDIQVVAASAEQCRDFATLAGSGSRGPMPGQTGGVAVAVPDDAVSAGVETLLLNALGVTPGGKEWIVASAVPGGVFTTCPRGGSVGSMKASAARGIGQGQ